RRRHTRSKRDCSSDVCSSDLPGAGPQSDARRLDPGFTTTSRPYRKGRAFPHLGIIMWTSWAGRLGTAIESDYETGRPIVRGAHKIGRASCREIMKTTMRSQAK